jgi:hypothetical protein
VCQRKISIYPQNQASTIQVRFLALCRHVENLLNFKDIEVKGFAPFVKMAPVKKKKVSRGKVVLKEFLTIKMGYFHSTPNIPVFHSYEVNMLPSIDVLFR